LPLCPSDVLREQENVHVDYEIPVPTALLQAFMYIIRTAGLGALQLGKLAKGENMSMAFLKERFSAGQRPTAKPLKSFGYGNSAVGCR
jgi:hypothetical protein